MTRILAATRHLPLYTLGIAATALIIATANQPHVNSAPATVQTPITSSATTGR